MGHGLFRTDKVCYSFKGHIVILYSPKSVCASVESLIMDNNLFTYVCLFHDIVSSLQAKWSMIYLHLLVFRSVPMVSRLATF